MLGSSRLPPRRGQTPVADSARSREVGVATEILLTKAEQVTNDPGLETRAERNLEMTGGGRALLRFVSKRSHDRCG